MKRLIEFPLKDGGSILVKVDEAQQLGGPVRRDHGGDVIAKANQTLEVALDRVKPAASAILSRLRDFGESPDEIGVEFGIKLSAEAGAFLASAGIEANYKVTLSWKRAAGSEATKP